MVLVHNRLVVPTACAKINTRVVGAWVCRVCGDQGSRPDCAQPGHASSDTKTVAATTPPAVDRDADVGISKE